MGHQHRETQNAHHGKAAARLAQWRSIKLVRPPNRWKPALKPAEKGQVLNFVADKEPVKRKVMMLLAQHKDHIVEHFARINWRAL